MSDGARLREARCDAGLRQAEVAAATGLSRQYYNDVEHGRRDAPDDTYARLCAAVGLASDRPAALLPVALGEIAGLEASVEALRRHWEDERREVARLHALLLPLVENTPIQYWDTDAPHCAYCQHFLSWPDRPPHGIHAPDCPWAAARAALGLAAPAP